MTSVPSLEYFEPPTSLRGVVRRYIWGTFRAANAFPIDFGPTGHEYLTIALGDLPAIIYSDRQFELDEADARVCLAGQVHREQPRFIQHGLFANFGVELMPGAYHYLFHRPADQLTDSFARLGTLDPVGYRALIDDWSGEPFLAEGRRLVEKYLHARLADRLEPDPLVEAALERVRRTEGTEHPTEIAAHLSTSTRTLRRRFREVVGLAPKAYAKIYRLNHAIELMQAGNVERVTEIAHACGYFDHAHFIRDFQQFLATTPQRFIDGEHFYLKDYLGQFRT